MSKDFSFDSVKNAGLYRYVRNFIVDHDGIDVAEMKLFFIHLLLVLISVVEVVTNLW